MHRLSSLAVVAGLLAAPIPQDEKPRPCPEGRTLERQVATADLVLLAEVTRARDCPPSGIMGGRLVIHCLGRDVSARVLRVWKGSIQPDENVRLITPAASDPTALPLKMGEVRVVFANARQAYTGYWSGTTDACKLPEGTTSEKTLIRQLDAWMRAQERVP